jgi:hypothetical protein
MSQDDLRIDGDSGRQQRGTPRVEQMSAENAAAAEATATRMAEAGAEGVGAALRAQSEMIDAPQAIGRRWVERRTAQAEFMLSLPNRLVGVRTFPDAVAVYRWWFSAWLAMCQEDGRRFLRDSEKIVTTAARCFTNISPTRPS